jgi:hypothetical protein
MYKYNKVNKYMTFFHHVEFNRPDPLDDGLADDIAAEKRESGIDLKDEDGRELTDFWQNVSENLKNDPDWFNFDNE